MADNEYSCGPICKLGKILHCSNFQSACRASTFETLLLYRMKWPGWEFIQESPLREFLLKIFHERPNHKTIPPLPKKVEEHCLEILKRTSK